MNNNSHATRILSPGEARISGIAPGTILRQRYRLDSEIGRGGMGVVYRGTDLELMREVAVKVLPEASSADARQRLIREARAAAALNDPHIVSVYDVGEAQGIPFFVMELVDGPSLSRARPIELERIVEVACQICTALEHAHANGVVHRDLKPDNVLLSSLDQSGSVKLADLGLALPGYGNRISKAGLVVGTASYMAPEQALGQPVDGRADLYALGVLLYELTTGRLPFKGDDALTIVSQHVHAPVVPPKAVRSDLPRALDAIILRLLAKDPAQRFVDAAATRAALRESLTAESDTEDAPVPAVAILNALSRGRLVGRSLQLSEARDLWRRAREGRGHAVLLSGEPGAGKSRLAREITIKAAIDGAVVLSGGCYEYEATTPYLPFVEAFRRWVREQNDDDALREKLGDAAIQIAKLAPEVELRLGPFAERPELPPHEERLLFFDAVAQVFANLAGEKGLLFYADDLHWADRGTLWLLGHLLRQLREKSVLILGAYRETELARSHPLAKALVDWNRERLATRIILPRFDREETTAQLSALLGEPISADFGDAVFGETEGNPFFVEEVLKALIEKGSVRRESGGWKTCDVEQLIIPQSMKEAIGNRLDRVSADTNEILRTAAVLGKTFSFEELMATTGSKREDAMLDALDEAVGAQLIAVDRIDSFTFTHDKIREVLYEELNPIRRRRLHRQAAEGLERRKAEGCTTNCAADKLAYHYIQAGDYQNGLIHAKAAAVEAERVFAFDEAVAAYGNARDCAEALGLIDEQIIQEKSMGKSYLLHGEMIAAGEHFERALDLAKDPQLRAHLHALAASSLVATGDQRGLDHLGEALSVLDAETSPLETANALSIEGRFHHLAGRHQKAIDLLERAAALVATTAEKESVSSFAASTISRIYGFLAGAYQGYGLFRDGDRWAQKALEFGMAHDVLFAEALGLEFLGENAMNSGYFASGLEYAEREREIAAKLQSRERRAWTYLVTGQATHALGDLDRSEKEFAEGIALSEAIGELRLLALLRGGLSVVQADQATRRPGIPLTSSSDSSMVTTGVGTNEELRRNAKLTSEYDWKRLDTALQTALDNFKNAESLGLIYSRAEAHRSLAYVHFRRNELDEAERVCKAALDLVSGSESRVSRLWLGPLYIEVLLAAANRLESEVAAVAVSAGDSISLNRNPESAAKRAAAREHLDGYQKLVSVCQSPRFSREAARLASLLGQ